MGKETSSTSDYTANLGFESKRLITADKLRNIMVTEEYKHVVLGLVFPHIYHPACDSDLRVAGFVQSAEFVESHCGGLGDISIYGQESNATTRRLAVIDLALRTIEADTGPEQADTFRRDLHPELRADYVLATARRVSASEPSKSVATDAKRRTTTLFKK